jgi:hypothetical protein
MNTRTDIHTNILDWAASWSGPLKYCTHNCHVRSHRVRDDLPTPVLATGRVLFRRFWIRAWRCPEIQATNQPSCFSIIFRITSHAIHSNSCWRLKREICHCFSPNPQQFMLTLEACNPLPEPSAPPRKFKQVGDSLPAYTKSHAWFTSSG